MTKARKHTRIALLVGVWLAVQAPEVVRSDTSTPGEGTPQNPVSGLPVSVLVFEDTCNGSIAYMDLACNTLALPHVTVTTWPELVVQLSGGSIWDLVMVNSYGSGATLGALDALDGYLAGGGRLIMSDNSTEAYLGHNLLSTLGLDSATSFTAPEDFQAQFEGYPLFSFPNVISDFVATDDGCFLDGQYLQGRSGTLMLATFNRDVAKGAIAWSPGRTALFNGFAPTNFNGDFDYDGRLDILELLENEIVMLLSPLLVFYDGASVDTVSSTGHRITLNYFGGQGTPSAWLVYRYGGEQTYEAALVMASSVSDTTELFIDLPTSMLTARGFEFFMIVASGADTAYSRTALEPYRCVLDFTGAREASRALPLPEGSYRMVGVPVDIAGSRAVANVIVDDLGDPAGQTKWRLFEYLGIPDATREYPNVRDVAPQRAYWLIARGSKSYSVRGYTRLPNRNLGGVEYYAIPLDQGWSQVANPLPFAVDWDSVLIEYNGTIVAGHPDSLLRDTIYQFFSNGYTTLRRVDSWLGFFVETSRTGVTALFRYRASTAPGPARTTPLQPAAATFENWTLKLALRHGEFLDDGNFVGVRPDARSGPDRYDFSEPPPAPGLSGLAFHLPDGDDAQLYRTDYRSPTTDGAMWQLDLARGTGRQISVTGIDRLPSSFTVEVWTDRGHRLVPRDAQWLDLPDDVQAARLIIGGDAFASAHTDAILPQQVELRQNFPNPFNPQTTLRFALPQAMAVDVSVINLLGQHIQTLVSGTYAAGVHDIVWNGTDSRGLPVGSGIYLYRLKTYDGIWHRKMLLLK